jgi:chorismate dehydratase
MDKKQLTKWRLGIVSYLNARPLMAGFDSDSQIELIDDVPARLPPLLDRGVVDAALVPVIDMFREGRLWQIVSDACIGSDGETLTVRVFSHVPADSVRRLYVDGDSHTSVVLARVIWKELYNQEIEVVPLPADARQRDAEAILLIGDKVVTSRPVGCEFEIDLGSAWKELTSLPFVFAVWAAPLNLDVDALGLKLAMARDRGVRSAGEIAEDLSSAMGWPAELAKTYLTKHIRYTLGPPQKEAIARFAMLAEQHGYLSPLRELVYA